PDLARRHAAGRTDHRTLAAVRLPRAARGDRRHRGDPAVPRLPGARCPRAQAAQGGRAGAGRRSMTSGRESVPVAGHATDQIVVAGTDGATEQEWGAEELHVSYGKIVALDGVSLSVPPGQVTAVVGGDGAGKSTLLRCLAGALAPDSGVVHRPEKHRLGYLPASSGLYPDLTVAENLDFRAVGYAMARRLARERAAEYLERAGLTSAAGRLAGQLSGGMRQKLAVIAAMLHHPELIVLDEPTTGVDPVSRSGLWWLIARAAAEGCA